MSVDPLAPQYPMLTPYQFASNSPILHVYLDGLDVLIWCVGRYWDGTKIKVTEYDRIDIVDGPDGNYQIVPDDFDGSLLNVDGNTINSWANGNDAKYWFDGVNNITNFGDLVGNIVALGSFVTSSLTQKVTKSTKTGRGTEKTNTSAAEDAIWQKYKQESNTVIVYHKGKLNNGKVGSDKSLSIGKNKESVSALDREGDVHQFDIPKNVSEDLNKYKKGS